MQKVRDDSGGFAALSRDAAAGVVKGEAELSSTFPSAHASSGSQRVDGIVELASLVLLVLEWHRGLHNVIT